jgi:phospholipid/cholesterol/gamma-HCH transport system permease protein
MEVSGTNPMKYLVVTRIMATTLMIPILVFFGDAIAIYGSYLVENIKGNVSFTLFFNQVFDSLEFQDVLPATIKTFFFGFAIGLVGCFKGYTCKTGTAGVGIAANSAVVLSSMLLFIIDFIAVFITDLIYKL